MRFILYSLLLFCPLHGAEAAEPLSLEMEFAPAGVDFTPELADDLDFRAYRPETALDTGSGDSGVVLRVWLPPESTSGSKNLILRPHYLWHVTGWFKYENRHYWAQTVLGRLLPPSADYYSTRDLVFEIEEPLVEDEPIYFHIRDNRSPKPVQVRLVDRQDYLIEDVAFSRLIATVYGMTLVMALANLLFFFFIREKPFLLYSIYMLLSLNGMVWQEGWIGRLITIEASIAADRALRIFAVLPMVAYYSFFRSYLGLGNKKWDARILIGVQIAIGILLVASLTESIVFGEYASPLWIGLSNAVLAVGALGVFVVTLVSWIRGNRLALYLFVANLVLVTATLMRIYDAFTFGVDSYWMNHAFEVALAIDAVLLSVAVANRTLSIRRERDKAQVDLARIDTAYKREQMLADFVRQAKALATDHERPNSIEKLDELVYSSIQRLIDVREVVLLSQRESDFTHRSFGDEQIIERFSSAEATLNLQELLKSCSRDKVALENLPDHPNLRTQYNYLLIPVRFREQMTYCVMLIIPRALPVDTDAMYGLREFVEKIVHARLDAENMSKLQHSAKHDDLTGVFNRTSIEAHVASLLEQCSQSGQRLSLAFVDIDHFKHLNDTRGHDFGDECLLRLCRTLQDILPVDAAIGRFGGDEFLLVLPGADHFHATEMLTRLNPNLIEQTKDNDIPLSVSIGIAECCEGESIPLGDLMKKADLSLYAAKAAGRGCIGAKIDTLPPG